MLCRECRATMRTLDSRPTIYGTRRRLVCPKCGHRATSVEVIVPEGSHFNEELVVIRKSEIDAVRKVAAAIKALT